MSTSQLLYTFNDSSLQPIFLNLQYFQTLAWKDANCKHKACVFQKRTQTAGGNSAGCRWSL